MKYRLIFLLSLSLLSNTVYSQHIPQKVEKIKQEFEDQNIIEAMKICEDVFHICKFNPVSECYYSNLMKDVHYYYGLSHYELYKLSLETYHLDSAISYLEKSYDLFRKSDILFKIGYLKAIKSIVSFERQDLKGLVIAWQGILEIYSANEFKLDKDLIENVCDYIKVTDKFTRPRARVRYSGEFAWYMIHMACTFIENGDLNSVDRAFINSYKEKYSKR